MKTAWFLPQKERLTISLSINGRKLVAALLARMGRKKAAPTLRRSPRSLPRLETLEDRFAPAVITTVAGTGVPGYTGDNGPPVSATLYAPVSVAVDAQGDIFIADTANSVIREVSASTGLITTVAGNGTSGYGGDGGLATSAELNSPYGIAIDGAGNLIIADSGNNRIREVNAASHVITSLAGNGAPGYGGDNGPASTAELNFPEGVAVDSVGDVFIADSNNNVIREINVSTHKITTVAGTGAIGATGDNGLAVSATLNLPTGVAVDAPGDVFIADSNNNVIREVNASTGVITTVAGDYVRGYSGDSTATLNNPATVAELNRPSGVTVDGQGDLFIADTANNVIREVNGSTQYITTVAGDGFVGYGGDKGPATAPNWTPLTGWRWTTRATSLSPTPATTSSAKSNSHSRRSAGCPPPLARWSAAAARRSRGRTTTSRAKWICCCPPTAGSRSRSPSRPT